MTRRATGRRNGVELVQESAKLKSRIAKGLSSRAGEREGGGGIGERTSSHTFGRTKKKDGSVKQREGKEIRQDEKT